MTIYTSAALTCQPHDGYCEQGEPRIKAVLAKHGLQWDSLVTMRFILDELGISDCVFSFCKVKPSCEKEAKETLAKYMVYLYTVALGYADLDPTDKLLRDDLKAIRKRCEGHHRPRPVAIAHAVVTATKREQGDPVRRYGLEALVCLSAPKADELAATHAGIALMEAGRRNGDGDLVQNQLRTKLEELL